MVPGAAVSAAAAAWATAFKDALFGLVLLEVVEFCGAFPAG